MQGASHPPQGQGHTSLWRSLRLVDRPETFHFVSIGKDDATFWANSRVHRLGVLFGGLPNQGDGNESSRVVWMPHGAVYGWHESSTPDRSNKLRVDSLGFCSVYG
jgi:hypothetical protein